MPCFSSNNGRNTPLDLISRHLDWDRLNRESERKRFRKHARYFGKYERQLEEWRGPASLIALAVLFVLTVGGVLAYWRYAEIYPSTDNAYTGADIVRIAPLSQAR